MNNISVYAVDDQAIVCDFIKSTLEADPEIRVLGTETDPVVAMDRVIELNPDVVLLDFKMPVCDGMDVLARCKPLVPGSRFLVLSGAASPDDTLRLVCAGASGVLQKTANMTMLPKAVKCVASGELWLDRHNTAEVLRLLSRPAKVEWSALRAPELEIVQAVLDGLSNREIGERLSMSEETVASRLKIMFRGLGLETRAELVQMARGHGMNPTLAKSSAELTERLECAIFSTLLEVFGGHCRDTWTGWEEHITKRGISTAQFRPADLLAAFKQLHGAGLLRLTKPGAEPSEFPRDAESRPGDAEFFYQGVFDATVTDKGRSYWTCFGAN